MVADHDAAWPGPAPVSAWAAPGTAPASAAEAHLPAPPAPAPTTPGAASGTLRWRLQPAPVVVAVDDDVVRLAGLTPDGACPDTATLLARVHPDDVGAMVRQVVGPARPSEVTVRWGGPGHWQPVIHRLQLDRDPDGTPLAAVVTVVPLDHDQDHEHRAVRAAFAASPIATVVLTRPQGTVAALNPAFAALVGLPDGGHTGEPFPDLVPGAAEVFAPVHDVVAGRLARATFEVRWGARHLVVHAGGSPADPGDGGPGDGGPGGVAVVHVVDITEQRVIDEARARDALLDPLTGLPNRRLLDDRLRQAMARAVRRAERAAVLFVDLDRFKAVNDEHGHEAGDAVLRATADRLRSVVRASDTVARLGGDEFVIVAHPLDHADHAQLLAARVVAAVGAPVRLPRRPGADPAPVEVRVGASVGVVVVPDDLPPGDLPAGRARPHDTGTGAHDAGTGTGTGAGADLLALADRAMYAAKAAGGGWRSPAR